MVEHGRTLADRAHRDQLLHIGSVLRRVLEGGAHRVKEPIGMVKDAVLSVRRPSGGRVIGAIGMVKDGVLFGMYYVLERLRVRPKLAYG